MTEVNIDNIVDYRSEYWAYVKKPKLNGHNLTGLCPFHSDHNSSFSVDLKTGKWFCHSENTGGNFIDFYAKINGTDTKEAYKQICEKYNIDQEPKTAQSRRSYTLEQYASEKKLPQEWLEAECRLATRKDRDGTTYLWEPYYDADGTEATYRKRYAKKELKWKYGSSGKIGLYGEWRLAAMKRRGFAILVEGESDTQSLWYMGIPALGVPGASMFKAKMTALLDGLKLYIHQEQDHGGEVFLTKTLTGLRDGGFSGEIRKFSCSDAGVKDPSDVLIRFGKEDAAKKIMELLRKSEKADFAELDVIPAAIPDAPINLRQPEGWFYSDEGIFKVTEKMDLNLVCRTPVIITQRLKSLDDGAEKIETAFKRDGAWEKVILPRSTVFTASKVTVLADLGCTITSENAKQVVRFLTALEAANIDVIRKAESASSFGWQPGRRFIPGHEEGIVLDVDPSQRVMALAYSAHGSFADWIETMRLHRERDKFRFILAAALTAPLLRIIRQRIFFVYNWGGSRSGKTAVLKAALSAWGDPDGLMVNFNATQVGLERTAAFYCDLPLGIDERQLAGSRQESLESTVYMIASGAGRIRGAKTGGIQAIRTWRTVALATGEEPLSTETSQTGVSTRVLEIYGGPFTNEAEASEMYQAIPENYGWAGPAFIRKLIAVSEKSVRDWYEKMRGYVQKVSSGRSGAHVAGVAAVALADAMIDTWFFSDDVPEEGETLQINDGSWERAKVMAKNMIREQMGQEAGDVNENAVQYTVDWVYSNKSSFGDKPMKERYGYMSEDGDVAYIYPTVLAQTLSKAGYSSRKTLRYMADNGYITSKDRNDNDGRTYSIPKRFDGHVGRYTEFFVGKASKRLASSDGEETGRVDAKSGIDISEFMKIGDDIELPFG